MKKPKNLVVLICVFAILAASLAGCTKPTPTTPAPSTADVATPTPTETPKEPTNIVYKRYVGPETATDVFYKTSVGDFLLKKFNVKFEFLGSREDTYRQELITDAATNSLPDILSVWIYANNGGGDELKLLLKGGREGLLAPLKSAIDQYAPSVKTAIAQDKLPIYTQSWMYDPSLNGEIYVLPHKITEKIDYENTCEVLVKSRSGPLHGTLEFILEDVVGPFGHAAMCGIRHGKTHSFRLLARGDYFELFVDEIYVQTYLLPETMTGRIGLYVADGFFSFGNLKAYMMNFS